MTRFARATFPIAVALLVCAPAGATAQTSTASAAPSSGKWQIEFHGGVAIAAGNTGGTLGTLPAGEALTTDFGVESLRVSSWLFGDGAALFNAASKLAGRTERIAPLDAILTAPAVEHRSGAAVGFRLIRALTPRFDAEFSLDYAAGGLALTDATATQIETTRQSFATAYNALFASSPVLFSNRAVSSSATVQKTAGGRMFVAGGLRMHLSNGPRHTYLIGGAAIARGVGAEPGATIGSSYKFTNNVSATPFTISESENVAIRFSSSTTVFGMAGLGFDVASWTRSGLRIDARVLLRQDKVETVIDAQGTPHDSDPAGANHTTTSPAIQWSSNQQLAGRSSLSGSVTDFKTLTGTHFQAPVIVTVGYFFRF